jgi:hypothetical protein
MNLMITLYKAPRRHENSTRARVMGSYWDYNDYLCGCGFIPPAATTAQRSTGLWCQNPSGPALSDEG